MTVIQADMHADLQADQITSMPRHGPDMPLLNHPRTGHTSAERSQTEENVP